MSREDVKGQRGVFLEQKGLQARHGTEAAGRPRGELACQAHPPAQSGDPDWAAGRAPVGGPACPTVRSAGPQEKPELLLKASLF